MAELHVCVLRLQREQFALQRVSHPIEGRTTVSVEARARPVRAGFFRESL